MIENLDLFALIYEEYIITVIAFAYGFFELYGKKPYIQRYKKYWTFVLAAGIGFIFYFFQSLDGGQMGAYSKILFLNYTVLTSAWELIFGPVVRLTKVKLVEFFNKKQTDKAIDSSKESKS